MGGGVKNEESILIFFVVFVTKDPLELDVEVDNFDGLAFGVLPVGEACLGTGTVLKYCNSNIKSHFTFPCSVSGTSYQIRRGISNWFTNTAYQSAVRIGHVMSA